MLSRDDRNAIDDLFSKLGEAERTGGPRDAEAEALIRQRIAGQPAAAYYLAQTVVVQQEALKLAERRIEQLESQSRETQRRGPWDSPQPAYDDRRQGYGFGGGGFLAGAAQTALGVAGGVMLGNLIGSIFSGGSAHAAEAPVDQSGANTDNSDTSSDAGSDVGNDDFGGGDAGGFDGGGFDIGGDF